ncbi:TetR/AcrR family transcriptional regulator [Actinoplanes sp. HUAS TT8]|uniref:TetR/AcrR family transcriptional regulator n=1 Tax=Actinoplanes sp. HUAS TT8 TaxID=3447453 RepID=UPI003F5201CE
MPAKRRTAGDGEQRRAQIITTAQHTIAALGFEGLRVRDVADRVEINIATLHYYFPSKEALVAAVVRDVVGTLERMPAGTSEDDPAVALARHLEHVLRRFETDRDQLVVLNECYARAGRDPVLRDILLVSDEAWAGFLRAILEAGRDRGQFRADLDPDAAVVLIIGFLKSLLAQLDLTAERARAAAAELLRSLAAPGGSGAARV